MQYRIGMWKLGLPISGLNCGGGLSAGFHGTFYFFFTERCAVLCTILTILPRQYSTKTYFQQHHRPWVSNNLSLRYRAKTQLWIHLFTYIKYISKEDPNICISCMLYKNCTLIYTLYMHTKKNYADIGHIILEYIILLIQGRL